MLVFCVSVLSCAGACVLRVSPRVSVSVECVSVGGLLCNVGVCTLACLLCRLECWELGVNA